MAKLVGAALLLVVLIDCFSDRTAYCRSFRSVGFTNREIIKCINSVAEIPPCKAKRCRKPRKDMAMIKQGMTRCLCCEGNKTRTTEMENFCNFSCYSSGPL